MEFVRSNVHCQRPYKWWDQFNGVTSFLDGSTIYGSNTEVSDKLRLGTDGLLKDGTELKNFLPTRQECGEFDQ